MKYFIEFINTYGLSLIHSIAITIISYVSFEIKKIYKKYTEDKKKKEIIKMVCLGVNQVYPNLNNEEKLNKTIINSKQILKEKGIYINDLELRMYIESSINYFHYQKGSDIY